MRNSTDTMRAASKSMTLPLLKKECRLAASPLSYMFIAFSVMAFIPGYPILVSAFFVCFGLFHSYQSARENNDILFSVLLPVQKSDAVRAKFLFALLIEGAAFALTFAFTIVRMTLLKTGTPYLQNPMMNANQVFLAGTLLIFALFNFIFIRGFFKTAYKFGAPFIAFAVAAFLVVALLETLHHLPGLSVLNATDALRNGLLWGIFAAGCAVFAVLTALAYASAKRAFDAVDL